MRAPLERCYCVRWLHLGISKVNGDSEDGSAADVSVATTGLVQLAGLCYTRIRTVVTKIYLPFRKEKSIWPTQTLPRHPFGRRFVGLVINPYTLFSAISIAFIGFTFWVIGGTDGAFLNSLQKVYVARGLITFLGGREKGTQTFSDVTQRFSLLGLPLG